MTKPTNAEIRKRHDEFSTKLIVRPSGIAHTSNIKRMLPLHKDRGILLDRLEDAETKLQKNLQTVIHHHKCCCDICRGREQAILEQDND